ncbi:MAG: ribbon-helix-helix domain-containing protein [Candidatus Nanoarchaeia archaeon]
MAQKTETLNVRVPDEIAGWIDSLVEKKLFSSRSEVIRHFLREYVNEQKNKNSNSQTISHNKTEGQK